MREAYPGPMLNASGFKQFFDGVSSQHTAYLQAPYTNARFEGDRGQTTVSFAVMHGLVMKAAKKGYPVRIHAIGDEAIHEALDIFEEALETYGAPRYGRNSLEHLENFQPDDIARLARLGVIASVAAAAYHARPGRPRARPGRRTVQVHVAFRDAARRRGHACPGNRFARGRRRFPRRALHRRHQARTQKRTCPARRMAALREDLDGRRIARLHRRVGRSGQRCA